MIKKIAFDITSFLVEEKIIDNDGREVYQFGTEQILSNSFTLAVISIISDDWNATHSSSSWRLSRKYTFKV